MKKFVLRVWDLSQQAGKGYPFPLLAIIAKILLYTIFIISNYFLVLLIKFQKHPKTYVFLKKYNKIGGILKQIFTRNNNKNNKKGEVLL